MQRESHERTKLIARLTEINCDLRERGIRHVEGFDAPLLTGYEYTQFYDWDLYFENIYLSHYQISEFCFNNLEAFFTLQRADGFIRRSFGPHNYGRDHHFKPFIAQTVLLGLRQDMRHDWLHRYYPQIQRYLDHWFSYDSDHNGLCYWSGGADHSGCDNQYSRCIGKSEGVDLNSYLVRELQAMAQLAIIMGHDDEAKQYRQHATDLTARINATLWDDGAGFYFDRDEQSGTATAKLSVTGFTPLWAGIASPTRVARLVNEHLCNPAEFWLEYPVATYAKSEDDFYPDRKSDECNWCGTTWIPTNYMICHGLRRYGYNQLADSVAQASFDLVLNQNPRTCEFYNSLSGEGLGLDPFWGWSALAYLMPLEQKRNYDPTSITNEPLKALANEEFSLPFYP